MTKIQRKDAGQFVKFLLVGGGNTLVTLAVILLLKSMLGVNPWLSNAAGYVAGMVNSFLWNKLWVFRSHSRRFHIEAMRFFVGFIICYGVQFAVTLALTSNMDDMEWLLPGGFTLSSYGLATIIGMCFYTVCNFIYNRVVTFK